MTVRGVGESHEAVKQTDSGFGVDAQPGPEGHPSSSGSPCPPELSHMTLSWVGTPMLAPSRPGVKSVHFKYSGVCMSISDYPFPHPSPHHTAPDPATISWLSKSSS